MNIFNPAAVLVDSSGSYIGNSFNAPLYVSASLYTSNTLPLTTQLATQYTTTFNHVRVAAPYELVNLVNFYNIDPLTYSTSSVTGGTITHVPNESSIQMAVTTSSGSFARLRTNEYFRYQAGKNTVLLTSVYHSNTGNTNQIRRWGLFDDNDGLFYQLSGQSFSLVRRSSTSGSVSEQSISQSLWNVDKMNGSGPSGINLDITKSNIYEIHFQWLGAGIVRWYIDNYLVHVMNNYNTFASPYIKRAVLPLSWEVENTAASTAANMKYICSSLSSEGGHTPPFFTFTAYTATAKTVSTTEIPLLTIRPAALFNSITNRGVMVPILMAGSTEGARASYRLVLDGTLTGASYVSVDSKSIAEYDITATALTGGTTLFKGFMGNSNDQFTIDISKIFEGQFRGLMRKVFATSANTLTLMAVNEAAGSTSMLANLTWREYR